uniref:Peptidase M20 dimerisation domain-containing protein n=1 Tax=Glossina palpalis gambiensis TaxID=67801 RepID=A0A1B0ANA4_9MUSC
MKGEHLASSSLKKQANKLGLPFKVYHPAQETKPIVIITWKGTQPELPSIMLNSHTDVVPVFPEMWKHKPFSADIDKDGKIYARETQDMKCVRMQYLAAIRALKSDEEIGGHLGMEAFVKTDDFKKLNIGFSLDDGLASDTKKFILKSLPLMAGHGSLLLNNTAVEKLHYLLDKMMAFRKAEALRLQLNSQLNIGYVTTVNLTRINGGVQSNVIPPQMEAVFDIR